MEDSIYWQNAGKEATIVEVKSDYAEYGGEYKIAVDGVVLGDGWFGQDFQEFYEEYYGERIVSDEQLLSILNG